MVTKAGLTVHVHGMYVHSLNILKSLQSFSFTDLTLETSRFDIINNSINSTNIHI